jgi:hypothetical protein
VWRKLRALFDDPTFWVKVHGTLAASWVVLAVPAVLWWRNSVPFLVFISVYANFAGSVASWQAARADSNSVSMDDLKRVEGKVDALLGKVNLLVTRGR